MTKDFDGWNEFQKYLDKIQSPLFDKKSKKYRFRAGEIWLCSVGVNVGIEICGKNHQYERPVLVIRKSGKNFICLPLTSKRHPNSNFYYDVSFSYNSKQVESYIMITNPKSYDVIRLIRKVRRLPDEDFVEVLAKLSNFVSGGV